MATYQSAGWSPGYRPSNQIPANAPLEAAHGSSSWVSATHIGRPGWSSCLLVSAWPYLGYSKYPGEWTSWLISHSLSFSLSLCCSVYRWKEKKKQQIKFHAYLSVLGDLRGKKFNSHRENMTRIGNSTYIPFELLRVMWLCRSLAGYICPSQNRALKATLVTQATSSLWLSS